MGPDNDYIKTVYQYLYFLYTRLKNPKLAQKYKKKLLEKNQYKLNISS